MSKRKVKKDKQIRHLNTQDKFYKFKQMLNLIQLVFYLLYKVYNVINRWCLAKKLKY